MVKNSTNINKMNNHIAGQIIEYKNTPMNDDGNQNHGLGQAQTFGRFKPYPPDPGTTKLENLLKSENILK